MRLYLLKAAPPEETMNWTEDGIIGRVRFLNRVWRLCEPFFAAAGAMPIDRLPPIEGEPQRDVVRAVHEALRSGAEETKTRRFHYNVTTAKFDELLNILIQATRDERLHADPALLYAIHLLPILLAPFAPHLADELWERMGHGRSVHLERWIPYDDSALAATTVTLVVQINGKLRARLLLPPGLTEEAALEQALADANIQRHVAGGTIRKRIYVADKLLNLVVG
jgi:leucyl-tRNA synthetase